MNKQYGNKLAKATGDACGLLTGASIGYAVFVLTLSFAVLFYHVAAWSVVSIMVGIALACLFTRLTLFISNCPDCKPDHIIKPVFVYLIAFSAIGVVLGVVLSLVYNEPFPNQMCHEAATGIEIGNKEAMQQCDDYRSSVQQLLDGVLITAPIVMVVWFVVSVMYSVSRFNHKTTGSVE